MQQDPSFCSKFFPWLSKAPLSSGTPTLQPRRCTFQVCSSPVLCPSRCHVPQVGCSSSPAGPGGTRSLQPRPLTLRWWGRHTAKPHLVLGHCTVPGAQKPGVFHVSHFKVLLVDAGAEASRRDGGPVVGTGMFTLPSPREALRGAGIILRGHCDGVTGDL